VGSELSVSLFPWWFLATLAASWGAVWGSFATVIIWRLPRQESIVRPGSHCPACLGPISWYDNIPVLSWLMLRGRCRHCGGRISPVYPVVELVSILLALAALNESFDQAGSVPLQLTRFFIDFTFFWSLLVVSIIDIKTMLVPDIITLPGIVLYLTYNMLFAREKALFIALAVVGAYLGVFLLFNFLYRLLLGVEAMGMGDAKLLAMIAALTGWKGALFALVAGAAQGILVNTPILVYKRRKSSGASAPPAGTPGGETAPAAQKTILRTQVPFGPMLALGALEFVLWGDRIIGVYIAAADRIAMLIGR
jgi:leader peptidase (prepilin peptidase)/N-methyltransferase